METVRATSDTSGHPRGEQTPHSLMSMFDAPEQLRNDVGVAQQFGVARFMPQQPVDEAQVLLLTL